MFFLHTTVCKTLLGVLFGPGHFSLPGGYYEAGCLAPNVEIRRNMSVLQLRAMQSVVLAKQHGHHQEAWKQSRLSAPSRTANSESAFLTRSLSDL